MKDAISQLVTAALAAAIDAGELPLAEVPDPALERPRDAAHGDWATTVALRSAKAAGHESRAQVAEIVAARIAGQRDVDAVEIAGPGLHQHPAVAARAPARAARGARAAGSTSGAATSGDGRRVQVEFVSANPVGPMHVGHGRWAALGDSMARVLEHAGWSVEREFYINDAGVQMDIFAQVGRRRAISSCAAATVDVRAGLVPGRLHRRDRRARSSPTRATCGPTPAAEREAHFKETAYVAVLEHLKHVLHGMGVDFDVWFSERTLHEPVAGGPTAIERAHRRRCARPATSTSSTARVWFRSTDFGDDKDRVLVKADGDYTYFAADIAYHKNKFDRGFDRVINIWGADHHGYVARMKAAAAALGHEGQLDVVIGQLVNLFRNGEAVRMSKRTGEMVTFEELLDEVGADAARYWFLRRNTDQPVDFDIELARQQSADNPVYYVQYAHARICSILRKAAGDEVAARHATVAVARGRVRSGRRRPVAARREPAELALMRKLSEFSEIVEGAARDLAPYRLTRYAEDLAATFHQFYTRVPRDDRRRRADGGAPLRGRCDAKRARDRARASGRECAGADVVDIRRRRGARALDRRGASAMGSPSTSRPPAAPDLKTAADLAPVLPLDRRGQGRAPVDRRRRHGRARARGGHRALRHGRGDHPPPALAST